MKSSRPTEVAGPETILEERQLGNERFELRAVPGFGVHWTRLRVAVKGEWLDLLEPVASPADLREGASPLGSYFLAPWSNRIAGARFEFEGRRHELRRNFKDGTAIHGDVRSRPWKVSESSASRLDASLDSRDFADFNFPYALRFFQSLQTLPDGFRISASIENHGRSRVPAGLGFHPYLRRRLSERDRDVFLVVPAERVYPASGCIPTGPAVRATDYLDLRDLKPLGAPDLDHCFTGLTEDCIRIFYPGTGVQVRFRLDPIFSHAVIYAPNSPEGPPRSFVAVEPVTHVNDGFNCLSRGWPGTGVKVLEPGERWGGSWELTVGDI